MVVQRCRTVQMMKEKEIGGNHFAVTVILLMQHIIYYLQSAFKEK